MNLENIAFRKWWIQRYFREIIADPLYQPTEKEWNEWIEEQIKDDIN